MKIASRAESRHARVLRVSFANLYIPIPMTPPPPLFCWPKILVYTRRSRGRCRSQEQYKDSTHEIDTTGKLLLSDQYLLNFQALIGQNISSSVFFRPIGDLLPSRDCFTIDFPKLACAVRTTEIPSPKATLNTEAM